MRASVSIFTLTALASLTLVSTAQAAWETPSAPTAQMAQQSAQPAPGITATMRDPFYKITATDVGAAVAKQLQDQNVENKVEALLAPGTPSVMYSSDHAVSVSVHALQVDPSAKRWQGQAYFLSNGKTESVRPIAGTYAGTVTSKPSASGLRTVLNFQRVGGQRYFDAAGFPGRTLGLDAEAGRQKTAGK